MGSIGSLGEVSYDIVANDKTGEGLGKSKANFIATAGDILAAIDKVTGRLSEFDERNAAFNSDLGVTALTLGLNAEELRGWANELASATDPIGEMAGMIDALARAGVRNHDAMIQSADGFDRIADAMGRPSDEITTQLIPAFQAFGVELSDSGGKADILAYTFNATEVTADLFTRTVKKIGPELNNAGVGMEDLATIMLILKGRGYDGLNMMQELNNATRDTADANEDGVVSFEEMLAAMKITNEEYTTTKSQLETSSRGYAAQAAQIRNENTPVQSQFNTTLDNTVLGLGGLTGPISSAAAWFGNLAGIVCSVLVPAMFLFPTQFAAIGTSISSTISGLAGSVSGGLGSAGTAIGGSLAASIAAGVGIGLAGVFTLDKMGVLKALSQVGAEIEKSPIGNTIMDALKVVLAPIGSIGAAIIDIVRGDFASIGGDMIEPFNQAGGVIAEQMGGVISTMQNASQSISDAVSWISSGLESLGGSADTLGGRFSDSVGSVIDSAASIFSGIGSAFFGMAEQFQGVFEQLMTAIQTMIQGAFEGFVALGYNIVVSLVNGIISAGEMVVSAFQSIFSSISSFFGGLLGGTPARAAGGPVTAGTPYMVGERGPELFVPSADGGIVPNYALPSGGGGGGDTITIQSGAIVVQAAPGQDAAAIAEEVYAIFTERLSRERQARGYRAI